MPPTPDDLEGNDTMAPPPETEAMEPMEPMGENVICVPLDALSVPDEGDKMTPPEPGDKVTDANFEGEVVRVEGNKAYVKLRAVNGKEVTEEPTEEQSEATEENALRDQAAQMPDNY